MNNQQLAEIKHKLSMTTPGDWIAYVNDHESRIVALQGEYTDPDARIITVIDSEHSNAGDLFFIEDAKKDILALLEEIECLQNKLAGMEQQIMVMDAENASLTRQLAVVHSWSIAKPTNDVRV